ncbi:hypothetical protein J6590_092254 [Homalodisca vitripennis]|nr:hypothetical protein J6590_092254 [Homalodisca vitripennis]
MSPLKKGEPALNQPLQSKQAGGEVRANNTEPENQLLRYDFRATINYQAAKYQLPNTKYAA